MTEMLRISFSRENEGEEIPSDIEQQAYASPSAGEFNFTTGCGLPTDDPSIADELFSDGKILPLFKLQDPIGRPTGPVPVPPPEISIQGSLREFVAPTSRSANESCVGGLRRSFCRFGRSSSVGRAVKPAGSRIFPFFLFRSKSTGSCPNSISKKSRQRLQAGNQNKTYYLLGSHGDSRSDEVRIMPVLNMPVLPLSRRSGYGEYKAAGGFLHYLLCTCGSGENSVGRVGDGLPRGLK